MVSVCFCLYHTPSFVGCLPFPYRVGKCLAMRSHKKQVMTQWGIHCPKLETLNTPHSLEMACCSRRMMGGGSYSIPLHPGHHGMESVLLMGTRVSRNCITNALNLIQTFSIGRPPVISTATYFAQTVQMKCRQYQSSQCSWSILGLAQPRLFVLEGTGYPKLPGIPLTPISGDTWSPGIHANKTTIKENISGAAKGSHLALSFSTEESPVVFPITLLCLPESCLLKEDGCLGRGCQRTVAGWWWSCPKVSRGCILSHQEVC